MSRYRKLKSVRAQVMHRGEGVVARPASVGRTINHEESLLMMERTNRTSSTAPWVVRLGVAAVLAAAVSLGAYASGVVSEPPVAAQEATETAPSGLVIAEAQAERGLEAYRFRGCAECHGDSFEGSFGPPIDGASFRGKWGGREINELVSYIRNQMPPGASRSVPLAVALDIVTTIMKVHDVPTGEAEELTLETIEGLIFAFPE